MDESSVQALVSKYFPDLKIKKIKKLGEGTGNVAYEINTDLIFRFPKKSENQKQLEQEISLQHILIKFSSLPVPEFIFLPPDHSFIGYKKLPGIPLIYKYTEFNWNIFSQQIGHFLSRLHTIPNNVFNGYVLLTENKSFKDWKNHSYSFYEKTKYLISKQYYPNIDIFFQSSPNFEIDGPVLCHNDLGIEHILVDDIKITGVIDWGGVALTDPACDFARIYRDLGSDVLGDVLAEYKNPRFNKDGLRERAIFYGKCLIFEDIFCGIRQEEYLQKSLAALKWMF